MSVRKVVIMKAAGIVVAALGILLAGLAAISIAPTQASEARESIEPVTKSDRILSLHYCSVSEPNVVACPLHTGGYEYFTVGTNQVIYHKWPTADHPYVPMPNDGRADWAYSGAVCRDASGNLTGRRLIVVNKAGSGLWYSFTQPPWRTWTLWEKSNPNWLYGILPWLCSAA